MTTDMKQIFTTIALALTVGFAATDAEACTSLLVGKKASADGSTIISYAADAHTHYGYLDILPAADHEKGAMREIREGDTNKPLGFIPEVAHTYSVVGYINEHQVTVTESTWGGRHELADSTGILDYVSLMKIALQRSKTAREAIKVMTTLVAEYGYYSEGESFSIGDPNEIWVMDMIGKGGKEKGAVWVAVRIPDDCISAHANQPRIHTFPLKDKVNCLYSKDVISFARKMGYFSGKDKDFDFAAAYNPADYGTLRGCDARAWAFFNKYKAGMECYIPYLEGKKDAEIMPLYVKPDRQVSVRDVQAMMRDHFEGTRYDMTKDPGAKVMWDVPYRFRPMSYKVDGVEYVNERAIATQQTAYVLVSQMRSWLPNAIGGVLWFGVDDANTNVFLPMYCSMTKVPHNYADGVADLYTLNWESAFWVNNWVANQAYSRYPLMIPDIRKVQSSIEDALATNQPVIEEKALNAYSTSPAEAAKILNDYSEQVSADATARYKKLGEYLLVKYLDGNRKRETDGKFARNPWGYPLQPEFPGYNEDYYRTIVNGTGDHLRVREVEK